VVAVLTAPSDPVFIAAAARALYLATLLPSDFGYPVLASAAVPAARVICVDAGALVPGHGTEARFSSSRDAALHEEDTSPAAIGTPGSPAAVAAPTRSLFQSDAIAIRATLFVGWAVRTGGVSYVDATW